MHSRESWISDKEYDPSDESSASFFVTTDIWLAVKFFYWFSLIALYLVSDVVAV